MPENPVSSETGRRDGLPDMAPDSAEQALADETDDPIPTRSFGMLPIVGLGGSAGSIGALQEFFTALPADSGMAFVVILHLSPDHESNLAQMFQRFTALPVVSATDGVEVQPNCIYVIPAGKHLLSADGSLRLTEMTREIGKRMAVDVFFRTLGDTHGPQAAAIVLSGADGDGAIGIKRIKERGGLTIAQDPDEAEHSGMPRAAISTGMVDWVLRVKEMPPRLVDYMARRAKLTLPDEVGPHPAQPATSFPNEDEAALRDVLAFLHTRTARDFSYYKRATILRRIARRMQVNAINDLQNYLVYLRTHDGEAGALLQDLLISVTNFFRDRDSFEALERLIPELFKDKGPGDTVRVWVAACATGEEAYSIAMLLCEHARTLDAPPQIQIFATDIDEHVIRNAREGVYPEAIAADVSEERLRRFFLKERRGYCVRREIRELVLFALHDLLKDSPFSRLDLVTCRNLLIYLNRDAQMRSLDVFYFALRPGGHLFLGASETVDDGHRHFTVTDRKHRIYLRRPGPQRILALPSAPSAQARALAMQERTRERPAVPRHAKVEGHGLTDPRLDSRVESGFFPSELHYHLLERISAPSLLVNAAHEIVHSSESAGRFLQFSAGEPTRNVLSTVHPLLRVELRTALYTAAQTHTTATVFGVPMETGDERSLIDIRVTPMVKGETEFYLVVFDARPTTDPLPLTAQKSADIDSVSRHIERELEATKAQLRETIEQSEVSSEELKAGNEELQAMNEELRSATEELETSREELQSVNEELSTVNQELKGKVDQLAHANSDLQNLMSATAIATVFLDRELRIMLYTPSAVPIFNLIPTDIGRPLTDLAHRLDYPEIVADSQSALARLIPTQREVSSGGHWFLARTLPYRTGEDRIAGVVLTFLDITTRKEAEEELRRSEARATSIVDSIADGLITVDQDWYVTFLNPAGEKMLRPLHKNDEQIRGRNFWQEFPEMIGSITEENCCRAVETQTPVQFEIFYRPVDRWFDMRAYPAREGLALYFLDITERKNFEAQLIEARQAAEAANQSKDHFLAVLSHELRTPLTPVLMTVAALEHDPDLRSDVREDLAMMKRNIELETKLIDDLLDLNRITSGKVELKREVVDLNGVVRHVCDICLPQLLEHDVRLQTELSSDAGLILADPARLHQVFWNVLKNAIKFTPEQGTVRVMSSRVGPELCEIRVQDSGIGIPTESLTRIFDAFAQGDAHISRQFGGLGLGLAISRALVELHGGSIRAESSGQGKGSTFIVELPGRRERWPNAATIAASAGNPERSQVRVLLVEDHADTGRTLSRLLRAAGFNVITARDVAGAKAVAAVESFDVLLSDLGLPDGDGYEIMRTVLSSRGIPGIAMSGYGMEEDVQRSKEAGFAEHFVKPLDLPQLIAAIRRIAASGGSATSRRPSNL